MHTIHKKALAVSSVICSAAVILSIVAKLLSSYVITYEPLLLLLPSFVVACEFIALVSISGALVTVFVAEGVKKTIACSLLPIFILFAYSFSSFMIKDFAQSKGADTVGVVLSITGSALVDTLLFALETIGAIIICVIAVRLKSKNHSPRAVMISEIGEASPLHADTPTSLGLLFIPLFFFTVELIAEIVNTVGFFLDYFETYLPSELIYSALYYLFLILLFVVGLIVCKAVKNLVLKDAPLDAQITSDKKNTKK